jgi:hypothetical protein
MKKKCNAGIVLIMLLCIIGFACSRPGKHQQRIPAWSSNDPLAIPYRIRWQKYEKGNLVRNNSFEEGKYLPIDTLKKSFSIDGWQKIGKNVLWVDLENGDSTLINEVYSGKHAVKIVRTIADEMAEKGEGVMSGFIRVIPGNYSFSFRTRLHNIRPYLSRLGTQMYDAIEIKLFFYDKNKNPLNSRYLMPYKGQRIDNSFKSLSFAGFNYVKDFNWGRIIAKSHNFPFSDGDIPDEARYVKIYIGLKGTGTMWIDDVDFHYTRDNFATSERMGGLIDSVFFKQDIIVPTPKKVSRLESIILYKEGQDYSSAPLILIPDNPNFETKRAALLLQDKLIEVMKHAGANEKYISAVQIITEIKDKQLQNNRLLFSIGKNMLYKKYKNKLPLDEIIDKPQGYCISTINDPDNIIFITGNNETGDFYAVTTLIQLFDRKNPVLYNAEIIDFPDVDQRYYYIKAWQDQKELDNIKKSINKLLLYKLNGAYIGVNLFTDLSYYLNSLESFGNEWKESTLFRYTQLINTGFTDSFPSKPNANILAKFDNYNVDGLLNKIIDQGHIANADGIAIATSFICPEDTTLCYNAAKIMDITEKFDTEKRQIIELQHYINENFKNQQFEYLTPWYNNELLDYSLGYAVLYLSLLRNDISNASIFWSGNSFYSIKTDAADIYRYFNLVKHPVIFLDNSLITISKRANYSGSLPYYPGKVKLYSLFETFKNNELAYYKNDFKISRVFINQTTISELETVKLITALDFYWNMESYNPDYSLWKVLVMKYGQEAAKELIMFDEAYARMLEINFRLSRKEQINKYCRTGNNLITTLKIHLNTLNSILGKGEKIVSELDSLMKEQQLFFEASCTQNKITE